jgi:hypothetical protein
MAYALAVLAMWLPGPTMSTEQLRDAVPGLAGVAGFLLLPMLGAWLRLLVQSLERNRPGLTRPRVASGLSTVRAIVLTIAFAFFLLTTIRAGDELRDIQTEAPVLGSSIQGLVVGMAIWAIYAVAWSTIRRGAGQRRRKEPRLGGLR